MSSLRQLVKHHNEFLLVQEPAVSQGPPIVRPQTWAPPPSGIIKVTFDAGVNKHNNLGSMAAIARDSQGQPMGWSCKKIHGITDHDPGEHGMQGGSPSGKDEGFSSVIFEGDAQLVISSILGFSTEENANSAVNFLEMFKFAPFYLFD
ncbi:uncharacterized protein LOC110634904 [Hevea brasiliensis]|uniref:uncharacterized protein LOC110634904 n=1 Tax=Hevea brasiliensis TaxID=3981 RepID=UPI0025D0905E|nr:uncharacterized protein LOC110634904 [Hevea brasiliensis]